MSVEAGTQAALDAIASETRAPSGLLHIAAILATELAAIKDAVESAEATMIEKADEIVAAIEGITPL